MFRGVLEAGGVVTRGPRVNDHPRGSARVLAKGPACILHRYYSTLHVSVYSDVSPPSPPPPPRPNRLRPSLFFHAAALEPWNERGYCLRSLLYKCYEMAIHPAPPSRYPIYRFNYRVLIMRVRLTRIFVPIESTRAWNESCNVLSEGITILEMGYKGGTTVSINSKTIISYLDPELKE